ncbi:MAG: RpiB/LacA/LacB family sugar-phosphate isomerase [Ginsengibacter sp.]
MIKKIGLAADHGGFDLKAIISGFLKNNGYEVVDFGAHSMNKDDDYPDFVIPLAQAISEQTIPRGIAICGSGVGASIAANKIKGVRAALINDYFSSYQGVEDDHMNLLCLGGRVTGYAAALEYVKAFLKAEFSQLERHLRRISKVAKLEK